MGPAARPRSAVSTAIWIGRGGTDPRGKIRDLSREPVVIPYQKFMSAVRGHLSWVIAGWLACQFAGAVAPLALHVFRTPSASHDDCDCPIAPGQACPMHHKSEQKNEADRTCKIRNASGGPEAALLAQAGGIGLLPPSTGTVSAFVQCASVRTPTPSAILRAHRPESPPPRA
jgi:hypothetical protein